ncbi:dihydroorotase [Ferrimicrobium sp.]|uniref:dihydroorotase n=1 Tax=Ferrimicrobium sp. TaxID=2926050 RepID=UPI0026262706|nr:dihydroorotase [Ferrimicrobium sp.]MCL5973002.1 dihydroorotase [Actinomycetota bacterium]
MRTVFANGVVFSGTGFARHDVVVEGDRIVGVGERLARDPRDRVLDCEGRVLCAPFVDLHTHLRFPGVDEADDPESIARAALAGGFAVLVAMANTVPPIDRVSRFKEASERFHGLAIEVIQAATVTMERQGERLVDVEELVEAGVSILSDDGSGIQRSDVMRDALVASQEYDVVIAQHSEDALLAGDGVVNDGAFAPLLGVGSIPEVAESVMVARDIELLKVIPGRLHLQHVSARESLNLFRQAKREGLRISAEVAPHHLLLTDSRVAQGDPRFKVNPPLRSVATQMALVQGVRDGTFDAIATDHAPHPHQRKAGSIREAAFGMLGLAEAFSVAWTALSRTAGGVQMLADSDLGGPAWATLASVLSALTTGPGTVLGRSAQLRQGALANLVILDPYAAPRVVPSRWYRSGNSPYVGEELVGRVDDVLVRGAQLVADGEVLDA